MATVTKGKTFISGETVEPADMHQLVDSATVTNIVDADISAGAAIAASKLAGTLDLSSKTVTLPDSNIVTAKIADAAVVPAKLSQPFTLMSAQNSTSGTSVPFTGIPSWAKRITLMLNGVSVSGMSHLLVQVGTGSTATTSGYVGGQSIFSWVTSSVTGVTGSGNGIPIFSNNAGYVYYGTMNLCNAGGNLWVASGMFVNSGTFQSTIASGGAITLGGALGMIRLITANGTDTFDAGTVNVSYE